MTADLFPETVSDTSDGDRRFTLFETIDWCAKKAGVERFDIDVAAERDSFWAPAFYSKREDGLSRPWQGNIWCNPPWSSLEPWVAKAWDEFNSGRAKVIAMLLPGNRQEQPWWQRLVEPHRDNGHAWGLTTHYLPGRQSFGNPGNPRGVGVGSPPFVCVLLLWRASR